MMYPTLVVAVLTAIPTVVQAVKAISIGTTWWSVPIAERTERIIDRNWECLGKSGTSVQLANNTKLEVAVCDTGDIWIRSTAAEAKSDGHVSWITRDEILGKKQVGLLISTAFGASARLLAQNDAKPLCVFRDKSGKIIRKVIIAPGICRNELIDQYTGSVTTVPSDCTCPGK